MDQPVSGGNHTPPRYNTRRDRKVNYNKLNKGITADAVEKVNFTVEHIHHMTLKEATLKFGNERAEESGIKEMKQMVDMDAMTPIMPNVARAKMKGGSKFTRTFMF